MQEDLNLLIESIQLIFEIFSCLL